jgi:hypothetical protein
MLTRGTTSRECPSVTMGGYQDGNYGSDGNHKIIRTFGPERMFLSILMWCSPLREESVRRTELEGEPDKAYPLVEINKITRRLLLSVLEDCFLLLVSKDK